MSNPQSLARRWRAGFSAIVAITLWSSTVMADDANGVRGGSPDWKLLTVTFGGTVSLIKGLTKDECDQMVAKLPTPQSMRFSISQDGYMYPWPTEAELKAMITSSGGGGGGGGGSRGSGAVYYPQKVPDGWIRVMECFQ